MTATRQATGHSASHVHTSRLSLSSWLYIGLLLVATFIGMSWAAFHFGIIGSVRGETFRVILPKALFTGGLCLMLSAQLTGVALLFGVSPVKGFLSLLIPGYWLLALRREGMYWSVVVVLFFAIAAYAAGIVLAS